MKIQWGDFEPPNPTSAVRQWIW